MQMRASNNEAVAGKRQSVKSCNGDGVQWSKNLQLNRDFFPGQISRKFLD